MHKLCRYVRFSINPFLPDDEPGFNSFASKPSGEGLAIFFELGVELSGEADPATGLIVNVSDIDSKVREYIVEIFAGRIRSRFWTARHIGYDELAGMLKATWGKLADKFGQSRLTGLSLKLNPYRTLAVDKADCEMIYLSEKFEFAAAHKLWRDQLSERENIEVFGRCANPAGHGHNYIVEITLKKPVGDELRARDFEKVVFEELIKVVDHKNLNEDLPEFKQTTPTVENIAVYAWNKLAGRFNKATLHCVTVWETDKTYSSYYG